MNSDPAKKTEREIIDHIANLFGFKADAGVLRGIGDDCAVLRKDNNRCFLVSTDILIAGVHFDLAWHPPSQLGRKAAAVNLSDIAAMGGQPRFALLSLAFPGSAPAWLDDFLKGFHDMLQAHNTLLVGGDTVKSSNDLAVSVTIIGEAAEDTICYRSGAVKGDLVFVSGCLGDAAAGLALCRSGVEVDDSAGLQQLLAAHLDPEPQVQLGKIFAESGLVHAMIDISDGLATDLSHICAASGVGAEIDRDRLPVSGVLKSTAATLKAPALNWVLQGGEDYQLLVIAPPEHQQKLRNLALAEQGREIYCIGKII
ncbi:MAG: thiamine-phosphate kinase, partial [Desulfobulbales bacterium]|nr:thiamine-phosphate kinase [Desulfobulbales bacterium]